MKIFPLRKQNFKLTRSLALVLLATTSFIVPANLSATPAPVAAMLQANLNINGLFAMEKAQRGRTVQAAIVVEIPDGYHVNANRPLGKYAVPTILKIEAPGGIRISPIVYPRATVHKFSFSEEKLAVYENRAVMRFNVTVPANYKANDAELRVHFRYQSCNNEACFPPTTRDITVPLQIASANENVKRTNSVIFGSGGGTRRARRK